MAELVGRAGPAADRDPIASGRAVDSVPSTEVIATGHLIRKQPPEVSG
jgi:hypothetical protein